ncbi:phage recombination protein Bet [Microbacterium sp. NPDC080220]|uniref:phage recombination protein Bet n=1 Tax=Microbacterium sp. NPDC080220 TaxID=3161017 RepID=UPI003422AF9C
MSNALATLPKSSDSTTWNPEERALVEAAGLVHTDAQSGQKTLAERATVAAFLQHCARTGLDPIARQIYSIARKSKGQLKWQIQISIDGARLVAERTGQYEGQTTPEFTSDGVTWTQVWLSHEPPKAARVGVYRRGFREALYAVALWDAYVQTKYNGDVTDMWQKMGPLMLAKCAEMLALRKAFPQDLSGLYSSEEMSQAAPAADQPVSSDAGSSAPANPPSADAPQVRAPQKDWLTLANAAKSKDELRPIFQEAQAAGDLNVALADGRELGAYLWELRDRLPDHTPAEDVVDAVVVEDDAPVTEWPTATIPNGDDA